MSAGRQQTDAIKSATDPAGLEHRLGHQFTDPGLLKRALTHASATPERIQSNERLEFLGDRVLGLVIAEMLCAAFPGEEEGDLGYRFSALARRESLARVADDIDLAQYIEMSTSEREMGGADKDSVAANTCEAVIGALYLDGGLDAAAHFISEHWRPLMDEDPNPPKDAKTVLQEWAQGEGLPLPSYHVAGREGPDHAPVFTISVTVEGRPPEKGTGASKREAEQAAAEALLSRLQTSDD